MVSNWNGRFFESTRGQLVALLSRFRRTVEELARALGLTDNGVRAHLAVLERDGIVRRRGSVRRSSGGGKPAYLRLRANPGGRRPLPEGLRARPSPAAGCPIRATWIRRFGGATEVGRSPPGGRAFRKDE
jgi:DNA-binding transcriptional ArsR family regulator